MLHSKLRYTSTHVKLIQMVIRQRSGVLKLEFWGCPKKVEGNEISNDPIFGEKLWKVSEDLTKVAYHRED